ncbi:rod shape-determining protein MreC [Candidatus Nomurabacteria bacterium]|nr:rod shape-determining protein MreC [Candidatus Nomurabacteria bacterium]
MSYLLDKKLKRNKFFKLIFLAVVLCILIYFRAGIFHGFSIVTHTLFRPVLVVGNFVGNEFSNLSYFLSSKRALFIENEQLKIQINSSAADVANYNSVVEENLELKEVLNRKKDTIDMVLANILAKPSQSLYDTLLVDVGSDNGVMEGNMVFAFGNIPVGKVSIVHGNSANVVLFSSSGEKTDAIISGRNIFIEAVGRGGSNFEIILPRDVILEKGNQIVLPGVSNYLLGVVEGVISDPRDSFQKVLFTSPVNIQELKFVEVQI